MDLESNKIFAAILIAGIIAMMSGFIANIVIHPEKLEQDAIAIEGAVDGAGGAAAAKAKAEPILAMIAAADVEKGKNISRACAACHTFDNGGKAGIGPNLWNVVGGKKDHMAGYAYSGAVLSQGGDVWTYAEMNKFLWKPKEYAPGTKMNFIGVKKPEDRAALIAYLRTLAPSPKALPSAGEISAEEAELAPPAVEEEAAPAAEETAAAAQ